MRYLPVNVYTSGNSDCTLNGVSYTHPNRLVIEHENGFIDENDIAEGDHVILELVIRSINGKEYRSLKPKGETRWTMFGGNYASSSDSRFSELNPYPLPIHDRIES